MEHGGVPSQTIEDEGDKTSHEEPIEDTETWRAPMQNDEIKQTELEATGPDMQSGEEENDIHLKKHMKEQMKRYPLFNKNSKKEGRLEREHNRDI